MTDTHDTHVSLTGLDILTGPETYQIWGVKLRDILVDMDAEDHILSDTQLTTGTISVTAPDRTVTSVTVTASDVEKWTKKDRKVLRMIRAKLTNESMEYVSKCTNAYQAWTALKEAYEPDSIVNEVVAFQRLVSERAEEGTDMEVHCRKMMGYRNDLTICGEKTPNIFFAVALLATLLPSWNAFVSSIDISDRAKISTHAIRARIVEEDRRLKAQNGVALYTNKGKPGKGKGRDKSKDKCRHCGIEGHWAHDCRKKKCEEEKGKDEKKESANVAVVAETGDNAGQSEGTEFVWTVGEQALVTTGTETWIGDSGASVHVVRDREFFHTYRRSTETLAGVGSLPIAGRGDVRITLRTPDSQHTVTLRDAYHAPSLPYNLISLARIAGSQFETQLDERLTIRHRQTNKVVATGDQQGNLYYIHAAGVPREMANLAMTPDEAHKALGHIGIQGIRDMVTKGMVNGLEIAGPIPKSITCTECVQGKQTSTAQPKTARNDVQAVGDLVTSDVWGGGTKLPAGIGGIRYLVTFTDVFSRFVVIACLKEKSDVPKAFRDFRAWMANQTGKHIKALRCDNGGEYCSLPFQEYCRKEGIQIQYTAPRSPAQNGISERLNRTIMDHTRTMLIGKDLLHSIWPVAARHFVWIKNRVPTRALVQPITLYKAFFGKKPEFSTLVLFGLKIWVLDERPGQSKLAPKSRALPFSTLR